jgi:hypothetical protein
METMPKLFGYRQFMKMPKVTACVDGFIVAKASLIEYIYRYLIIVLDKLYQKDVE